VLIYTTLIIDIVYKDKNTFYQVININDVFKITFTDLRAYIYKKYIKG